jgi:nucleotide-binding universal stress UspA family protein
VTRRTCPTPGFARLLAATDGSAYSAGAVREAISLAAACSGALTVVHVFEVSSEAEFWDASSSQALEESIRKYLQRIVDDAKKQGVLCNAVMHWSDEPWRQIVAEATKRKASAIVMGSHGRTGLLRLMMGSTVARVIGHAPCRVLVVPAGAGKRRGRAKNVNERTG